MVDPLAWWPGKYAECRRIARLVDDRMPDAEILASGGPEIFPELLEGHRVVRARIADGIDLCRLPYPDDAFDVGVSARVLELLPPALRAAYVRELLRVCRYRLFLALPLQPELESIDKIKNAYVWDVSRVWQYPAMQPEDLERVLEGCGLTVTFHVEAAGPDAPAPFVIAEIVKTEAAPAMLAPASLAAH